MTITEKYIAKALQFLGPSEMMIYRDGIGYKLPCPFCSIHQKRESKVIEKCAYLYPIEGTFTYFFSCKRGMRGGKGNHTCSRRMRFDTFLKEWNPLMWRQFKREKVNS